MDVGCTHAKGICKEIIKEENRWMLRFVCLMWYIIANRSIGEISK